MEYSSNEGMTLDCPDDVAGKWEQAYLFNHVPGAQRIGAYTAPKRTKPSFEEGLTIAKERLQCAFWGGCGDFWRKVFELREAFELHKFRRHAAAMRHACIM